MIGPLGEAAQECDEQTDKAWEHGRKHREERFRMKKKKRKERGKKRKKEEDKV